MSGYEEALKYARIQNLPKDGDWFSMEIAYKLVDWVVEKHGINYVLAMGREMPSSVGGELKFVFASLIGFERVLKRVQTDIPKMMFKGAEVHVEFKSKEKAIVTLENVRISDVSCQLWHGALEGFMRKTKTEGRVKDIISEENTCAYEVMW